MSRLPHGLKSRKGRLLAAHIADFFTANRSRLPSRRSAATLAASLYVRVPALLRGHRGGMESAVSMFRDRRRSAKTGDLALMPLARRWQTSDGAHGDNVARACGSSNRMQDTATGGKRSSVSGVRYEVRTGAQRHEGREGLCLQQSCVTCSQYESVAFPYRLSASSSPAKMAASVSLLCLRTLLNKRCSLMNSAVRRPCL
jgi:hypothetical protein